MRAYNFSAGPAALPLPVLEQARNELLDWQGRGVSVMEISHRSPVFEALAAEAEADLRTLLNIPKNYRVLFLPGGGSVQFAMVPLNLLRGKTTADYIHTGVWSGKALNEARHYCDVNVAASAAASEFTDIPDQSSWHLNLDAAYVHYTTNETIGGLSFPFIPETCEVPLVADMSSDILSEAFDVTRFGLIYASAQKNIGPAGLSIVIVREDLLEGAHAHTPTVFNYKVQAEHRSMVNTPPTYSWYLAGLVFKWLLAQGGLSSVAAVNERKAAKLYKAIDESYLYLNLVNPAYRSKMNVPFQLARSELASTFVAEALAQGLAALKGHALVGGVRARIYNAVPEEAVDALIAFMRDFERRYG
jgi:phosphoserine aminotransferase